MDTIKRCVCISFSSFWMTDIKVCFIRHSSVNQMLAALFSWPSINSGVGTLSSVFTFQYNNKILFVCCSFFPYFLYSQTISGHCIPRFYSLILPPNHGEPQLFFFCRFFFLQWDIFVFIGEGKSNYREMLENIELFMCQNVFAWKRTSFSRWNTYNFQYNS